MRKLRVDLEEAFNIELLQIKMDMPQFSLIDSILCLLWSYDVPLYEDVIVATFDDDTVMISVEETIQGEYIQVETDVHSIINTAAELRTLR